MAKEFDITNNSLIRYYLGIKVKQLEKCIFFTQKGYMKEVFKKFDMDNSKLISNPFKYGLKLPKYDDKIMVDETYFLSLIAN